MAKICIVVKMAAPKGSGAVLERHFSALYEKVRFRTPIGGGSMGVRNGRNLYSGENSRAEKLRSGSGVVRDKYREYGVSSSEIVTNNRGTGCLLLRS